MTRPRSSPDKSGEGAHNNVNNNSSSNNDRLREEDAAETLRADLESIEIVDREDEVDGGMYGAEGDDEEEEDGAAASASAATASALQKTPPKDEEKSRQRHSSVQRVEHLHRFSLPAPTPVSGDVAPIVNVLPGPVVS